MRNDKTEYKLVWAFFLAIIALIAGTAILSRCAPAEFNGTILDYMVKDRYGDLDTLEEK